MPTPANSTPSADALDSIDFDDVYFEGEEEGSELEQEFSDSIKSPEEEDQKKSIDPPPAKKEDDDDSEEPKDEDESSDEGSDDEGESDDNSSGELTIFEEMNALLGFEVEGSFEDSPQGLVDYTKAVGEQIAKTRVDALFGAYPEMQEYFEYRQNGGDPAKYFETKYPELDYGTITEIASDDYDLQERIVRESLTLQGLSDEDVKEAVEDFRQGGLLQKQAERSLKALQRIQKQEKTQIVEQQKVAAEAEKKQIEEFWTKTKEVVDKATSFDGISIPEKEKGAFFDFISKPQAQYGGMSERDHLASNMTLEERLMLDALIFQTKKKGIKLPDLIDKKASTKSARGLRERLRNSKESTQGDTPERAKRQIGLNEIDFDGLM